MQGQHRKCQYTQLYEETLGKYLATKILFHSDLCLKTYAELIMKVAHTHLCETTPSLKHSTNLSFHKV